MRSQVEGPPPEGSTEPEQAFNPKLGKAGLTLSLPTTQVASGHLFELLAL